MDLFLGPPWGPLGPNGMGEIKKTRPEESEICIGKASAGDPLSPLSDHQKKIEKSHPNVQMKSKNSHKKVEPFQITRGYYKWLQRWQRSLGTADTLGELHGTA